MLLKSLLFGLDSIVALLRLHITRHENFGVRFKLLWVNNASEQIYDFALQEGEADVPFLRED